MLMLIYTHHNLYVFFYNQYFMFVIFFLECFFNNKYLTHGQTFKQNCNTW